MENKLIVSDPTVMMGKPVIAATRITVELVPTIYRSPWGGKKRPLQDLCIVL